MTKSANSKDEQFNTILEQIKILAREYYDLTGRPLGVTGEIAELEAKKHLGLELAPVRQAGYDATRDTRQCLEKLQIKGRYIPEELKPGQRLGVLSLKKEWDAVLLVLLDKNYNATEIYEAKRDIVKQLLEKSGSGAQNESGALGVMQFRRKSVKIWPVSSSET